MAKPKVPITDPAFRYTPAACTDIRKLFARIKREQAKELAQEPPDKVVVAEFRRNKT